MAYRIRSIRPEIYELAGFDTASLLAQFVYLTLPNLTDDEGRGHYLPRTIAGVLFPRKEDVDVAPALAELVEIGLLHRYEVDGRSYYHIPRWKLYQKPNRPQPSDLPDPVDHCQTCKTACNTGVKTSAAITPRSVNSDEKFTENSVADHVMESRGEESRGGESALTCASAPEPPLESQASTAYASPSHERIAAALKGGMFPGELERLEIEYFGQGAGSFATMPLAKANELAGYLEHPIDRRAQAWAYVDGNERIQRPYRFVRAALGAPESYPDVWGEQRRAPSTKIAPFRQAPPPAPELSADERRRRYSL